MVVKFLCALCFCTHCGLLSGYKAQDGNPIKPECVIIVNSFTGTARKRYARQRPHPWQRQRAVPQLGYS